MAPCSRLEKAMTASQDIARDLERLHEEYAYRVNLALEEDRETLVWQLADAYADEALLAIIANGTAD